MGDVFGDGKLFPNTPAFMTGKRYCVNGWALTFSPSDSSSVVRGDADPPPKKAPSWMEPPAIKAREKA